MDANLEQITNVLRNQLVPLDEEASHLQQQLVEINETRDRLNAALTALGVGSSKARTPKRSKPCVTKREVINILVDLLHQNGTMPVDDLKGLAKDRLTNDGNKSLSGYALRFKNAIQDETFSIDDNGQCGFAQDVA